MLRPTIAALEYWSVSFALPPWNPTPGEIINESLPTTSLIFLIYLFLLLELHNF